MTPPALVIAALGLACLSLQAQFSWFLQVDDLRGDATTQGYEDWLEVAAAQHGVSRLVDSPLDPRRETTPPQFHELTVLRTIDRASPLLFGAASAGTLLDEAVLELARTTDSRQRLYQVRIAAPLISSWTQSAEGDRPTEQVSLNYTRIEVTYTDYAPDGRPNVEATGFYDLVTGASGSSASGTPTNAPPTISAIADQSTPEDTPLTVTFTVGDDRTPAGDLTLTAVASPPELLPASGVQLGGSGPDRQVVLTPLTHANGAATVTLAVSDGALTNSRSFNLTVVPVNDPPQIDPVPPQVMTANTSLELAIALGDVDHPVDGLDLQAGSGNPALIPPEGLLLSGIGASRLLTITPIPGQSGEATITLTVSDGLAESVADFVLVVNPTVVQGPTDILLSAMSVPENSPAGTVVGELTAVDPDSTSHTFVLLDSAQSRFEIVERALRYTGTAPLDFETEASHAVLIRAIDPTQQAFTKSFVIEVLNVNEAPTLSVNDPSTIELLAGAEIPITRFQVGDIDAGSNPLRLTLEVVQGRVLAGSSPQALVIEGAGTTRMSLRGSIAVLNSFLAAADGLSYQAPAGVAGLDQLTVTLSDEGFTGSGDPLAIVTTLGLRFYLDRYDEWQRDAFAEAELADPELEASVWGYAADADHDGLPNLVEYGLGSDPRSASSGSLPSAQIVRQNDQQYLGLTLMRRQDPNLTLDVGVASEVDGTGWSANAADLDASPPTDLGNGFEAVSFRDRSPTSSAHRRFFRVRWVLER